MEECSFEIMLKTKKCSNRLNKEIKFSKNSRTQKGSLKTLKPKKCKKEFCIKIMLKILNAQYIQ